MPTEATPPLALRSDTWTVFLSSTIDDYENYRREVQSALLRKAEAACFLSEDWQGGYDDTVEKCRRRVADSSAFVLLLGYWYGSIPTGSDRSITQLEFELALERWKGLPFPPLAVMMPKLNSDAFGKLRTAADGILARRKLDVAEHSRLLEAFHQQVIGSWRTVTPFEHEYELRENVIVSCLQWRGRTPLAAAKGQFTMTAGADPVEVTDAQLGRLGRKKQQDEVEVAQAEITDHGDVPAVALLIHGDENAGQRAFLHRLLSSSLKHSNPRARIGRLPLGQADLTSLCAWVAQSLGLASSSLQSPEQLADRIAAELRQRPLLFVIDRISDFSGGVSAFRDTFWLPLYQRLRALRVTQPFPHRLTAVLADYSGDPTPWQSATCSPNSETQAVDYTKLLSLTRLGQFTRTQVLLWLSELEVPDAPAGRRAKLVDRATKNEAGVEDSVPIRVFERLRSETLWPQQGEP